ncbi:methylmalonyl-CoA epimerase [Virgibacillus subterraneus]|uniref:Methylmalonyl-CoA epimerase n=2 Tax=Virgibacillus TaxID=84406 RepID=A0A1H0Y197_9BACI|nr:MULTISPECIES: VOC family protein [Virgibacillus]SDQ08863.1 methylmalonyl-CoA epimerase [Virgibacillus salinus]SEP65447.1 methylmalonyl-CoA epimerase [Virgibacillus subterraneus]
MDYKLDHIGIAVRNLEDSIYFYESILGGSLIDRYKSDAKGVESEIAIMEIGGDRTELLAPTNNTTSPIARFLKQKGKGVHHIAYHVGDLNKALDDLKNRNIRVLEDSLRTNKHGRRLIYLNPADTDGTIIEYCDYPN